MRVNNFNSDEKILRHHDKLDYFFNGHKTLIVTELDLTNRCNNNCPGCCGVKDNGAELNKDQIDFIIDGLLRMNNRGIIISGGGEPLISPYFEYAVNKIRQSGMKLGINSNGLALDEDKCKVIAENAEYFRISLDAATPEIYKKTHGMPKEAFTKTIENAKLFAEIRNKIGSLTSYGIGFLTSLETEPDMESFVELSKDCGADFAQFRPFTGENYEIYNVSEKIEILQKKYSTSNFKVVASIQKYREMESGGIRNYDKCMGMFFSTVITADAKMFACLHYRQSKNHYLGQISESYSVEDIFLSPRIREVYKSIDCSGCPSLCRNDAFNRTLNELSLDVFNSEFM